MSAYDTIRPGSIVQIGKERPADRGMTWTVMHLNPDGDGTVYATIRSGSSGQVRTYPLSKLSLFRLREDAA